ncbi:MAG: hypothetical protein LBR80_00450 [Deltaproteobacteria bacterium]|nr:hypothetical protein [Deltaproteobacteria bacterium]
MGPGTFTELLQDQVLGLQAPRRATHTSVSELATDLRLLEATRMIDGSTPSPKAPAFSKRLLGQVS